MPQTTTQSNALPIPRARQLITQLKLQRHPEGGWYREVFRSRAQVQADDGRPARPALTSIYFLLETGQYSRWHKVSSDEVWVHLEGLPIDLWSWDSILGQVSQVRLGPVNGIPDARHPEVTEPQHVIAAGFWQAAQPQQGVQQDTPQGYSLAACMVGPGFDFSDFEMMQTDGREAQQIASSHPHLARFI